MPKLFHRGPICAGAAALAFSLGMSAAGLSGAGIPAAQAQDGIRIGAPLALTGGLADEGKKQRVAYDMWLERVKEAGGIEVDGEMLPVELISYDYQTDGKRASQLTEKLITDDKVDFLVSPFGSGHTKIAAGVAERYGIPIIAPVASSESVYDQGYRNLFGILAPNAGLTEAMVTHFPAEFPETKTVAILGREDVFPDSMATAMAGDAGKAGIEVVYDERYAIGALDLSAPLTQIKGSAPDWIYITGYTQDLVLARKQMADLGLTAPIITMVTGPAYQEFTDNLGELADGVTSATWWHHSVTYEGDDLFGSTEAFYKAFVQREGADPDYVHAASAAALIVLTKAIQEAGSVDKDKVRDALASMDLSTFYGPVKFGANGMNEARDLPIIQVHEGKPVVLYLASIAQAEMIAAAE